MPSGARIVVLEAPRGQRTTYRRNHVGRRQMRIDPCKGCGERISLVSDHKEDCPVVIGRKEQGTARGGW